MTQTGCTGTSFSGLTPTKWQLEGNYKQKRHKQLKRSAEVKGQALCDLLVQYGLIEDNDP